MAKMFFARIAEADHDSIRNIVHNYPAATYDKWLYLQSQEVADWEGKGHEVVLVDISVDDISHYCRETGARCDVHVLKAIAFAKGTGKFK